MFVRDRAGGGVNGCRIHNPANVCGVVARSKGTGSNLFNPTFSLRGNNSFKSRMNT